MHYLCFDLKLNVICFFILFYSELVYKEILDFQTRKEEESMQTG